MTRLCFLCGKKIGFLRSMSDQQYCSSAHRQEARLASSQALREEEDVESWSVEKSKKGKKPTGLAGTTAGQTASIFAFLTVGGLLVAAMVLPGSPSTNYPPSISADPGVKRGFMDRVGNAVSEAIRSSAPVTLHHDFHTGFGDWSTVALHNSVDDPRNWLTQGSAPEPGKPGVLRLWTKSMTLQNYEMEFGGRIQQQSLTWAFRASDQKNYYGGRLLMGKNGVAPSVTRYAVVNGQEVDRNSQQLTVPLERGVSYRVRVSVEDDRFLTYLNGQLIGHWNDKHLTRGGVGFIGSDDDPQQVAWVDVSERDSFLGRMLAHFSLFVAPPGLNVR